MMPCTCEASNDYHYDESSGGVYSIVDRYGEDVAQCGSVENARIIVHAMNRKHQISCLTVTIRSIPPD
jgi:hypothetical protein